MAVLAANCGWMAERPLVELPVPPLDTEAMKRAGTIIGAAWEPADKHGRASDLLKQMIWLGSKASDGLSRWNPPVWRLVRVLVFQMTSAARILTYI